MAAEATPALLYVPALPEPGADFELGAAESHYVARVCRARPGERLEATDGRGARATLRLVEARGAVRVLVEAVSREPEARRAWVCCGAPEGERADWLIEKLAELGVGVFQPVDASRGRWRAGSGRRARWERLAIAALRQSRRSRLMEVADPVDLPELLGSLPSRSARWLADPSGPAVTAESGVDQAVPSVGLIGPSAGFDEAELKAALDAGFRPIRLSDARLRTETAALAWAAWWSSGGS